jgi:hypothetical protein
MSATTRRQASLEEFATLADADGCQAVAITTGEPCQRHPVGELPYCPDHLEQLLDDEVTD